MSKSDKSKSARSGFAQANQRGAARLAVVQALYQMDVGAVSLDDTIAQFALRLSQSEREGEEYLPADLDYFRQLLAGVLKNQLQIDPLVDLVLATEWPVTRIDATLRAILRAGAFEILFKKDIPVAVVISEYVDVARAFFDGAETGIVNGVLDGIAAKAKSSEK